MNKKQSVLTAVFQRCQQQGDWQFDNDLVEEVMKDFGGGNKYDMTKVDHSHLLPPVMKGDDGYFIVHLGEGRHRFVRDIARGYHQLEPISDDETIEWPYRPSLLNEFDSSESNILSIASNQRILHDFLYLDIVASPKMYLARRTKTSGVYRIGQQRISFRGLQLEMDMVLEKDREITVMEGKNNFPPDFAIYQLFHPFLYFDTLKKTGQLALQDIQTCYLQRKVLKGQTILRLHLYRFPERELTSIELVRKAEYRLKARKLL